MRDTILLLKEGFKEITALDTNQSISEYAQKINDPRLKIHIGPFASFDYKTNYHNLVSAQYSLPFAQKEFFPDTIRKILKSITTKGVFSGTFFGINDSWNHKDSTSSAKNFHKVEDIYKIFQNFAILRLEEKEEDKTIRGKSKHWHKIHVTTRKV